MAEGWISLHRKLKGWEWYHKSEMVHLFIHFLVSANHKKGKWQGVELKRGQLITGLKSLKKETSISEQTLRTCIKRLKSTGEITVKSTNKFSVITICNYDSYQIKDNETNKQNDKQLTNNQHSTNIQLTTNNNKENNNNENNKYYTDEIKNFTISILDYFPTKPKKIETWFEITDKLIRIDKYNTDDILIIINHFRNDSFWCENFQSYTKLRKKKDEGLYIDYFKNILIAKNNGANKKINPNRKTTPEGLEAIVSQFPDIKNRE